MQLLLTAPFSSHETILKKIDDALRVNYGYVSAEESVSVRPEIKTHGKGVIMRNKLIDRDSKGI